MKLSFIKLFLFICLIGHIWSKDHKNKLSGNNYKKPFAASSINETQSCNNCLTVQAKNVMITMGYLHKSILLLKSTNNETAIDTIMSLILKIPLDEYPSASESYFNRLWIKIDKSGFCSFISPTNCVKLNIYAQFSKWRDIIDDVFAGFDTINTLTTHSFSKASTRKLVLNNAMCTAVDYQSSSNIPTCQLPKSFNKNEMNKKVIKKYKQILTAYKFGSNVIPILRDLKNVSDSIIIATKTAQKQIIFLQKSLKPAFDSFELVFALQTEYAIRSAKLLYEKYSIKRDILKQLNKVQAEKEAKKLLEKQQEDELILRRLEKQIALENSKIEKYLPNLRKELFNPIEIGLNNDRRLYFQYEILADEFYKNLKDLKNYLRVNPELLPRVYEDESVAFNMFRTIEFVDISRDGFIMRRNGEYLIRAGEKALVRLEDAKTTLKDLNRYLKQYAGTGEHPLNLRYKSFIDGYKNDPFLNEKAISEQINLERKSILNKIKIREQQLIEVEDDFTKESEDILVDLDSVHSSVRLFDEIDIKDVTMEIEANVEKKAIDDMFIVTESAAEFGIVGAVMLVYGVSACLGKLGHVFSDQNNPIWLQDIGIGLVDSFGIFAHYFNKYLLRPIRHHLIDPAVKTYLKYNVLDLTIRLSLKGKKKRDDAAAEAQTRGDVMYFDGKCWNTVHGNSYNDPASSIVVKWIDGILPNIIYGLQDGAIELYSYTTNTWTQLQDYTTWNNPVILLAAKLDTSNPILIQVVAGLQNGAVYYYSNQNWIQLYQSTGATSQLNNQMVVQFPDSNNKNDLQIVLVSSNSKLLYYNNGEFQEILFTNGNTIVSFYVDEMTSTSQASIVVGCIEEPIQYYDGYYWTILDTIPSEISIGNLIAMSVQFPNQNDFNDLRIIAVFSEGYSMFYFYEGQWTSSIGNYPALGTILEPGDQVEPLPLCVNFPTGSIPPQLIEVVIAFQYGPILYYSNSQWIFLRQSSYSSSQVVKMQCKWESLASAAVVNKYVAPLRVVASISDGSVIYYPESAELPCWIYLQGEGWNNQLQVMDVSFVNLIAPTIVGGLSPLSTYDQSPGAPNYQGGVEYFNGFDWQQLQTQGYNSNAASIVIGWSSDGITPLYAVYGLADSAIEYYDYVSNTWTQLHDNGWQSSANFLYATGFPLGSSSFQVIIGLADNTVQYYNNGGFSQIYSGPSKSSLMQMAVQFANENTANDLRIVIGYNVNGGGCTIETYFSGSWSCSEAANMYSSDRGGTYKSINSWGLNLMQVQFPVNSDLSNFYIVIAVGSSIGYFFSQNGIGSGSSNSNSCQNGASGSLVLLTTNGLGNDLNPATSMQVQFPNQNSANDLRILAFTQNGGPNYYTSSSWMILSSSQGLFAQSDANYLCVDFPTGNDASLLRFAIQFGSYSQPSLNIVNSVNSYLSVNNYAYTSSNVQVASFQCNWQPSNDPDVPQLQIVVGLDDGSVQYYPSDATNLNAFLSSTDPSFAAGPTYWETLQQSGQWTNQVNVIAVNFSSVTNFVAVVAGLGTSSN